MQKTNSPKLAFYYCLSLVTLVIGSVSVGIIGFELINKLFPLISESYYSESGVKSAISGIIISFPIYYYITWNIYKGIKEEEFSIDAGPRKWLIYFIIFISSVIMIGSLIELINNYLDGEATINSLLKIITVLSISATIFGFYFTDIKSKEINHSFNKKYFLLSTCLVLIIFISAFLIIESPTEARNRKMDQVTINNLEQINASINRFYSENNRLPENIEELVSENYPYIMTQNFIEQSTNKYYIYNILSNTKFELCATFYSTNLNKNDYYGNSWRHNKGYQCITKKIEEWNLKQIN